MGTGWNKNQAGDKRDSGEINFLRYFDLYF